MASTSDMKHTHNGTRFVGWCPACQDAAHERAMLHIMQAKIARARMLEVCQPLSSQRVIGLL